MFLLNPGRYVIGDPGIILNDETLKKLWGSESRFNSLFLKIGDSILVAPSTGKSGEFHTDMGRVIATETGRIAFVPHFLAGRLLPFGTLRLTLTTPTMLFFNAYSDIVLDGRLTIFVGE